MYVTTWVNKVPYLHSYTLSVLWPSTLFHTWHMLAICNLTLSTSGMWRRAPMFWVHVLLCLAWCTFHVLWTRLHGVTSQTPWGPPIHIYIPEQSSSMDQNPFVEACCPSHTKLCHAFYGIGRFIIVMQFYCVTGLKRNLSTTQTCLRWKNPTVPGI